MWRSRSSALAGQLVRQGDLRSAPWHTAFTETPRHVFVPTVISITESGSTTLSGADPAKQQSWLDQVYSDDSLVTQCMAHPSLRTASNQPLLVSTSSSTMPSLMVRMLEALDVRDGHRVLEIGTGTGYNAALLCHRLGSNNVVSIDIDPILVASAGNRLADLGHYPTLVVGDGTAGAAHHGPYDRIIATAAVPSIPLPTRSSARSCPLVVISCGFARRLAARCGYQSPPGPVVPGTPPAPALHSIRQCWSVTTVSDSCCNCISPAYAASAVPGFTTRALALPVTACSSTRVISHMPRSSPVPNLTHNARSSRSGRAGSGTASRPPISCGATSTVPIPVASGLSPTPLPSSSGSTPTKAGTDGPFRLSDYPGPPVIVPATRYHEVFCAVTPGIRRSAAPGRHGAPPGIHRVESGVPHGRQ